MPIPVSEEKVREGEGETAAAQKPAGAGGGGKKKGKKDRMKKALDDDWQEAMESWKIIHLNHYPCF